MRQSFDICNFANDEGSIPPDLKSICGNTEVAAFHGMLIARCEMILTFSIPDVIYKLAHLVVEFDLF